MRILKTLLVILMIVGIGCIYARENTIQQVGKNSIKIDGHLEDWEQIKWFPVVETTGDTQHKPSPALNVKTAFAFDDEHFYLAVRAFDDKFETVNRSWRYGDGFFFTLVTDEGKDRSRYVYQYGFSREEKFLVFGNGEYFPRFSTRDVRLKYRQLADRVDYEIAIPYRLLKPFNPFSYEKVALNLIYTDRDRDKTQVVMLFADPGYDTERTDRRGGQFFSLKTAIPKRADENSFHLYLKKNFFLTGENISIGYALNLDKNYHHWKITAKLLYKDEEKQAAEKNIDLKKGLNRGTLTFKIEDLPISHYLLQFLIHDSQGRKIFNFDDFVFIQNRERLSEYRNILTQYKKIPKVSASLSNLEIRLQWFADFYKKENYEDISPLIGRQNDILYLIAKLEKGEAALFAKGTVKRYAHRSLIDNTLQPYSVFLPSTFRGDKKYPLIVALHGSGVDERGFFGSFASSLGILGCPILAPKARGLSDWYTGESGKDVFECIEHFLTLFPNIDREKIFLGGFSMGGYGTWLLGLRNPGYFKGLLILSGALAAPPETGGENILKLLDSLDSLKGKDLLIIHGDKDNAVPIANTRKAVEKLKALNAKFTYIEISGAGHGNYNKFGEIIDWIRKHSE